MKLRLPLFLTSLLISSFAASAADYTWVGTSNDFHTAANWTPTYTSWESTWRDNTVGNNVIFNSSSTSNKAPNVTFSTFRVGSITVTADGYSLAPGGSARPVNINGEGGLATFDIQQDFSFGTSSLEWNNVKLETNLALKIASGKTLAFNGNFQESAGKAITVSGGGVVQINKRVNEGNFSANWTIKENSQVQVMDWNNTNNVVNLMGKGTITIEEGAKLTMGDGSAKELTGTGAITQTLSGSGTLEIYGSLNTDNYRTLNISGDFTGTINIKKGTFALNSSNGGDITTKIGNATLLMDPGTQLFLHNPVNKVFSGNITLGAGQVDFRAYGNTDSTFSGKFTGQTTSTLKILDGPAYVIYTGDWSDFRGTYDNNTGRTIFNTGGFVVMEKALADGNGLRFLNDTLVLGAGGITSGSDFRIGTDDTGNAHKNLDGKLTLSGSADFALTLSSSRYIYVCTEKSVLTIDTTKYDPDQKAYTDSGVQITINPSIRPSANGGTEGGSLVIQGKGTVILKADNTFSGTTTIKSGTVDLGTAGKFSATSGITLYSGSTTKGTWLSSYNKDLIVKSESATAAPASWQNSLTVPTLRQDGTNAKISIDGNLTIDNEWVINLDTASTNIPAMVTLTNASNKLTLGASGKIVLNTQNALLESVGEGKIKLNLINADALTSFSQNPTIEWLRKDELFSLDTSTFYSQGYVTFQNTKLSFDLIPTTEGAITTPYTPSDSTVYVGAADPNVTFNKDKIYNSPDGNYRISNGYGNFTFRPEIASGATLYALGMTGGTGDIILTNNNNAQSSTQITNVNLIVDSSGDGGSQLVLPGSGRVGILGTGAIDIYGSSSKSGSLTLRTGGTTDQGGGTYLIDNSIILHENASIRQEGPNAHTLTGDITIAPFGYGSISNTGTQDLTIQGNISSQSGGISFAGTSGKIILSGAKQTTLPSISVSGAQGLSVENGRTLNVQGINLSSNAALAFSNSTLNLGTNGIGEGTSVTFNNSMLKTVGDTAIKTETTLLDSSTFNVTSGTLSIEKGITGSGNLTKNGSGKLIIHNDASPATTGKITSNGGTLQLGQYSGLSLGDGSNPNGVKTATYILGGDLAINSGTLIGAIDAANNDIHFGATSKFSLGLDLSDQTGYIRNANNITVDKGASIYVNVLDRGWTIDTPYNVLSANGSITGEEFTLVLADKYAFVDVQLDQTDKNVRLILSGKIPDLQLNTRNERTIFGPISQLVTEALEGRYGELRGELLDTMQQVSKMTETELQDYISGTALSTASLYTAMSAQVQNMTRHVGTVRNRVTQIDPYLFDQLQKEDTHDFWVEGLVNYADVDSDNNAPGYKLDTWGVNMGAAFSINSEFFWGLGFNYMNGKTDIKGGIGETTTDTYNMDLFGRYKKDNLSILAVVSGGFSSVDYTRHSYFKDTSRKSEGSADGSQLIAMVEAAYDIPLNESGSVIFQPIVNVTTGFVKIDAFDETGLGNAGYHVEAQQVTMASLGAGARVFYTHQTPESYIPYRAEVRALVTQDVGDTSYDVDVNYIGYPAGRMNITGIPLERTAFVIGAGAVVPVGMYTSLFADVNGEFRSGQSAIGASLGVNFQF